MNPKLALLERKFARANPERPAPETSSLGASIDAMVQEAVQQQVADAVKEHHSAKLDRLFNKPAMPTDYRQIEPVARTPAAKPTEYETTWYRDGGGRIAWAETVCNGVSFKTVVQRDGGGNIVRTKTTTGGESPVLPPPDIPFKAKAREYKEGV